MLTKPALVDAVCSGHLLYIVFTVVDVHSVCPTLVTNPLKAGRLLGGALRSLWSWPCSSGPSVLAVSLLILVLCPASLQIVTRITVTQV